VSRTHVPDAVYEQAKAQFSDEELVKHTLLIASINAWNRFAISFRSIHPVTVKAAA
jgi:alkylhydroperoxidase family enzyme